MKISQFKQLEYQDYRSMTTEEIRKLVQFGANILNRRINALERANNAGKAVAEDALKYVEKTGGLFNLVSDQMTMGKDGRPTFSKDRTELLRELKREIYFAKLETSTVKGAKKVFEHRSEILLKEYSPEEIYHMSKQEIIEKSKEAWEKYSLTIEEDKLMASSFSNAGKSYLNAYTGDPEEFEKAKELFYEEQKQAENLLWENAARETGYMPKWERF